MSIDNNCMLIAGVGALAIASGYVFLSKARTEHKLGLHNEKTAWPVLIILLGLGIAAYCSCCTKSGNDKIICLTSLAIIALGTIHSVTSASSQEADWSSIILAAAILSYSWCISKNYTSSLQLAGPLSGAAIIVAIGHVLPRARENDSGPDNIGYVILSFALASLAYLKCGQDHGHIALPPWMMKLQNKLAKLGHKGEDLFKNSTLSKQLFHL